MKIHFIRNLRSHNATIFACCIAYITQSISVSFTPLLFVTFNRIYSIPFTKITLLITISFAVQLFIDLISAKIVNIFGHRICMLIAHTLSSVGFIGLGILPKISSDPFSGITISCIIHSCGCGMIENSATPIISLYSEKKNKCLLSLIQSFFCWGTVFVIISSTIFFSICNIHNRPFAACLWAIVPLFNIFLICFVPFPELKENQTCNKFSVLFKNPFFLILALIMLCAGAAEHSISQWASVFSENCLGISKTTGDIAGPCLFAALMGIARVVHSIIGQKVNLRKYMFFCGIVCSISFLMTSFTNFPFISFIGCALCGFSCGVFWPGTFSLASKHIPTDNTASFALLAFAGDLGSTFGPGITGFIANLPESSLSYGILAASIFPVSLTIFSFFLYKRLCTIDISQNNAE